MMTRIYIVGIVKDYFPPSIHPKAVGESFQYSWKVRATSCNEAVASIWDRYGQKVLAEVMPTVTVISLHCNEPKASAGGLINRLLPIKVWEKNNINSSDEGLMSIE